MKHLKYTLKQIPKFKHLHKKHIDKDDNVEINGGSIFTNPNSNFWKINKDYGSTMGTAITVAPGEKSASTLAQNGGGINLHGIDRKLMNLNFGEKKHKKIKF